MITAGVLVTAACGPAVDSPGHGSADEFLDRTFVSTSVNQAGGPRSLVEGPLRVWFGQPFEEGENETSGAVMVGWTSGCNDFSGPFDVALGRLEAHQSSEGRPAILATAMGCRPEMAEQEGWLERLFGDSPRWTLDARELTISTSNITIELEEDGEGSPHSTPQQ